MVDWEPRDGVWYRMMLDRAGELAREGLRASQISARTGVPLKVAEGCVHTWRRHATAPGKGAAA